MNLFKINCPAGRSSLEISNKPYFTRITESIHLGYKKGKSVCRWVARWRVGNSYSTKTLKGAVPDDALSANGSSVLSYEQALLKVINMNVEMTDVNIENTNQAIVLHCSFCSKPKSDVKYLIAGKGSFICGECIDVCNDIVATGTKYTNPPRTHA